MEVENQLPASISVDKKRWYAIKLLENDSKVVEHLQGKIANQAIIDHQRITLEKKHDDDMESIVTDEKISVYSKNNFYKQLKKGGEKLTISDKIDKNCHKSSFRYSYLYSCDVYCLLCISHNSRNLGNRLDK